MRENFSWVRKTFLIAILSACWGIVSLTAFGGDSDTGDAAFLSAMRSITHEELAAHVFFLASDELEGREAGMPGCEAAGEYLRAALAQYGLQAGGTAGYVQEFGEHYRNILATLPGSDPKCGGDVILLGAHYDHVGYGGKRNVRDSPGAVHNGADDNASGTATVLEIAQAMTFLPRSPRRTILFAFFDGEEKGLLGSKHWVEHPTCPLQSVKFMFNLDMVGRLRNQRVEVYGWRTAPGVRHLIAQTNRSFGFDLEFSWQNRFDSDHASFFRKSVPNLMLHTGLHEDYHKATDDADKLNYVGMEEIGRWVFRMVTELADAQAVPSFRPAVNEDSEGRLREILDAPPNWRDRLGIKVVTDTSTPQAREKGWLRVEQVFFGTPAETAGIQPGDRILAVNDRRVSTPDEFAAAVLLCERPTVRLLLRPNLGRDPEKTLEVPLTGPPIRLGIQWYVDDAVPHSVMVSHVLPGSPADAAGIEPGDYIYSVNQKRICDPDHFDRIVQEAGLPMELEMERRGRIWTVVIPPTLGCQQVMLRQRQIHEYHR